MAAARAAPEVPAGTVYTIGHSTLPIERFVAMLQAQSVDAVADIRTVPRSRHNPQFGAEALAASLADHRIDYVGMPELGGLRRPRADSPNGAWRNLNFRGYADYMQTAAFAAAVDGLVADARRRRVALMCAEAVPWRCHRSLVADALLARGVPVLEIMPGGGTRPHRMTPFARVEGTRVDYPALDAGH